MDKISGSMEALSAIQLTADMEGLDVQSRTLLHNKEVLAVILQGVIPEYQGYSRREIMEFIETDSIVAGKEVSSGRTNTQVQGDVAEFVQLNEKASRFDLLFRAKNPLLTTEDMLVNLHVDVEPQKSYQPGYPVEKRGLYYLARSLSSQLSLVTEHTDYGSLEKCYSIWICRDDIPAESRYSVSFYQVTNTKNIGKTEVEKENYDLMTLVVIRLGDREYHGRKEDEGYELLHFLNTVMYPHREDFMEIVSDYIDFSENEELWKEEPRMFSLSQCIYEDGLKDGIEQGIEKGIEKGIEQGITQGVERGIIALVQDHLEENIPRERTVHKLQKHFSLAREKAEEYYEHIAQESGSQN